MGTREGDDRGVSAVIGVVVMVAVTVVMAAVVGTFVPDLGGGVDANPQVGVTFEEGDLDGDGDDPDVGVTLNSAQRADDVEYRCAGGAWQSMSVDVGTTETCEDLTAGEAVVVRATYDGNTAIVQRTTVDG